MIYEFQAEDGTVIERMMAVSAAVAVGKKITLDGVEYTRIASAGTSSPPIWKPYVSSRLPRNLEGVECTKQGKPIINSQKTERDVAARLGWERE